MRYDATLKKLFQQPPNRLLSVAFGKSVTVARMLPTDLITVENLHPDLLFEDHDGNIIHAEMHGYQMSEFACRNLIYYGLLLRDYKRHPLQIVFWIGRDRIGIPNGLNNPPYLQYSYAVIDARDIDAAALLEGGGVGESMFAILCKMDDPRHVISEILQRISALPVGNQKEALAQLLVLSGLRGLKAVVREEVTRMPLSFDIHENEFLEEVFQEGKEKGRLESAQQLLLELLETKFGPIPSATKVRITEAAFEDIQVWQRRVLASDSLDKIFTSP
jgi:hypothetical protein